MNKQHKGQINSVVFSSPLGLWREGYFTTCMALSIVVITVNPLAKKWLGNVKNKVVNDEVSKLYWTSYTVCSYLIDISLYEVEG